MIKNLKVLLMLSCVSWNVMACMRHDEAYFKLHPKVLQEALAECPLQAPKWVSCVVLHQIAIQVNEWVYELRMSPQGYGQSILSLQETIAKQESAHQANLQSAIEKNKQALRERLAIVSWLESPTS